MRLLVALDRPRDLGPAHIEVTADGTATVGEVARAIASCPESGLGDAGGRALTLRFFDRAGAGRELAPSISLIHSGISSGSRIEVVGAGGTHWTYTTVIADATELLETVPNRESSELRWVAEDEVAELPLHPGFAASWPQLRDVTATIPLRVNRSR